MKKLFLCLSLILSSHVFAEGSFPYTFCIKQFEDSHILKNSYEDKVEVTVNDAQELNFAFTLKHSMSDEDYQKVFDQVEYEYPRNKQIEVYVNSQLAARFTCQKILKFSEDELLSDDADHLLSENDGDIDN